MIDNEPTPEFAALFAEEFECRLKQLDNESLCRVALLKLEGYTNDEIAEKLGVSRRTIDRKLAGIRAIWRRENRK